MTKQKYFIQNGKRVYICAYKHCKRPAAYLRYCKEHYMRQANLTPITENKRSLPKVFDEIREFWEWLKNL